MLKYFALATFTTPFERFIARIQLLAMTYDIWKVNEVEGLEERIEVCISYVLIHQRKLEHRT